MGSDHNILGGELEGKRAVIDNLNEQLQHSRIQSDDSFLVEMEPFSPLIDKQMNVNPTITRNLSRKGSIRVGDSIPTANHRVAGMLSTSSRATLRGSSTPEKAAVVAANESGAPLLHHEITITNGTVSSTEAAVESKSLAKKFSFRGQSIPWLCIDPRRMFLFFATMSSLGTMLLIYFTLSTTSKLNGDGH